MTKDEALDKALEALECLMGRTESMQDALDAAKQARESITAIKQARSAPVQEPVAVYGYCPICGAEGVMRERRLNGYDKCAKGHTYPSSKATPPAQPAPVQEPVAWISEVRCVGPEYGKKRYGALPVQSLQPGYYAHTPLYTSPPAQRTWVGLTDDERSKIWGELPSTRNEERDACIFAECIEIYLKERNT